MTRLQMRTIMLDWLDDPDGGYFTESISNLRIYLALLELQKQLIGANQNFYTERVYTNLVSGQQPYALPTDFMGVVRLSYVTSGSGVTAVTKKIRPITENQQDLIPYQSGDPEFYWIEKNNLILYPVPNVVREMRMTYNYIVANMANDAASPDAPEHFHEFIPILAARDGFLKDGRDLAPIKDKLSEYRVEIQKIANQRQIDEARSIVETGETW